MKNLKWAYLLKNILKKNQFQTNRFKVFYQEGSWFYTLDRLFIIGQENSAVRAFYKPKTSPFS